MVEEWRRETQRERNNPEHFNEQGATNDSWGSAHRDPLGNVDHTSEMSHSRGQGNRMFVLPLLLAIG